jgi:sec-independent protein translocase protein TatA
MMNSALLAFIGMPGPMELMIILVICLLLFGSSRLPSLMRNLGSSAREFKKGVQGMEEEMDEATRAIKEEKVE